MFPFPASELPFRAWELAFPALETAVPPMGNARSLGGKRQFPRQETESATRLLPFIQGHSKHYSQLYSFT